ncbi:MAG TPA: carboxypeptidase-like regulatory domain-containing protein [Candidatus Acidoferrum sp.]
MKWGLAVASVVLGLVVPAISAETVEPVSVDRMCGRLVSIEETPDKGTVSSSREEGKSLAHVRIRLFSPTVSGDCCTLMTPVAEAFTGRDGVFQFKKLAPGDYLLVATMGGSEYKLLVRYEPVKKAEKECSEFQYTLEQGKFLLRRSITVTGS